MEKLKVGDEVYSVRRHNFKITGYEFRKVVRLTKTMAVLKSGIKIVNEPLKGWDKVVFLQYGSLVHWHPSTDEARKESEVFYKNKKISDWFLYKEFTDEEKELIYNMFNKE